MVIQDTLNPAEQHINKLLGSTYKMLANIRVAYHYMDKDMMKRILTSMIRPRLEYAAVVWSPHAKKDITKLERIQRVATKMVPELSELTYEDRLREMGLPTLQDRRERGDLITLYKILNGIEKLDEQNMEMEEKTRQMRGHSRKIRKSRCLKDTKKYSFSHRIVDTWNGLKEEVVTSTNIHKFKEMLDIWRYGDRTL